jgi:nicotinamidase-related amidase
MATADSSLRYVDLAAMRHLTTGEAVLTKGKDLAQRFRAAKAPVVLVNVAFSPDFGDALRLPVDQPPQMPPGGFPDDWSELVDGLAEPTDLKVTKRSGARSTAPSWIFSCVGAV